MFGIFRKKKKDVPQPDPAAERLAEHIKEQTKIAELQSQIAELRRRSSQTTAEIAQKIDERAALMAQIQSAPQAQKVALALRVQNIDKQVTGLNNSLALIEQQIGNNEDVIRQIGVTETISAAQVGNVVDLEDHKEKIRKATEAKTAGDINVQIANELTADLTGDTSSLLGNPDLASIIAEAEGTTPGDQANIPASQPEPTQKPEVPPLQMAAGQP